MEMTSRNKYGEPFIEGDHQIIVPDRERGCTDIICLFLFFILMGGFIGLMAYGIIKGDPSKILDVYNINQIRCTTTQFSNGYFTDPGSVSDAICVRSCPTQANQVVECLPDGRLCITGLYSNTVETFDFDSYCVPDTGNISDFFNESALESWASDLGRGWPVLLAAAAAAMILSMFFMLFVRCCAGVVIWVMIMIGVIGIELVGIMMILEAKGVKVSPYINSTIESVSYDTLIIVGSCLIVFGVILFILVICLKSRIAQGIKAVQVGAIFIFENCCIVLMPVTQAIFVVAAIAGTVVGVIYLYSLGALSFEGTKAFPNVDLSDGQKIMVAFCVGGGVWTMFFFHGCNHYMMCSAVSVWYFNHESQSQGSPFGDSMKRLVRYNMGSVAITALINGILFVLKLIVQILSFEAKDDDHCLVSACIKCMNCVLCLCKTLIRFLNDSVYVHIAVFGTNYCSSAFKAFNLVTDNIVKVAITDGISIFFTVLGVIGITAVITVGAYFACIRIQYLATLLTNPVIVTIGSGFIAFVIACLYLSMIDISAQAALQCYFIDYEAGGGRTKYAKNRLKDILEE